MKTEEELRARVRELVKAELKRRLDEAHEKLPHLCVHNYRHALDTRKTAYGDPNKNYNRIGDVRHLPLSQSMGLCMLGAESPEQWKGDICDEPIDAQRCPYFTPKKADAIVVAEFSANLKEPPWVEANLPAVAALLWASGESVVAEKSVEEEPPAPAPAPSEEPEEPESPVAPAPLVVAKVAWWARFWRWLFRRSDARLTT